MGPGDMSGVVESAASARSLDDLSARVIACRACPRLVAWRETVAQEKRAAFRDEVYWGRPVPGWGDPHARIVVVGLALSVGPRIPFLGRLPGDIAVNRGNVHFYFPIVTSLILSALLTLILNLFFRR